MKVDKETDKAENVTIKRQSIEDTRINNTGVH